MEFGSTRHPLHPELAEEEEDKEKEKKKKEKEKEEEKKEKEKKEKKEKEKEKEKEGVAPLLKSRDPHLAGGKKHPLYYRNYIQVYPSTSH